jgi:hypothetical protein
MDFFSSISPRKPEQASALEPQINLKDWFKSKDFEFEAKCLAADRPWSIAFYRKPLRSHLIQSQ